MMVRQHVPAARTNQAATTAALAQRSAAASTPAPASAHTGTPHQFANLTVSAPAAVPQPTSARPDTDTPSASRWNDRNVAVDRVEQNLQLPPTLAREVEGALAGEHAVEFGHTSDPARTMDRLASQAAVDGALGQETQARSIVLPGLASAGLRTPTSHSLATFGAALSAKLPFRKFRFRRDAGELQLEGKINPWVRIGANGRVQRNLNPVAAPPGGGGWRWVQTATSFATPAGPSFRGTVGPNRRYDQFGRISRANENALDPPNTFRLQKHHLIPTLHGQPNVLVLARKHTQSPWGGPAFAGGFPALPGGTEELRHPGGALDTLTSEVHEELHGYQLQPATVVAPPQTVFGDRTPSPNTYLPIPGLPTPLPRPDSATYRVYTGTVAAAPLGAPAAPLPHGAAHSETVGSFQLDLNALAAAGNLHSSMTDQTVLDVVAQQGLAAHPIAGGPAEPAATFHASDVAGATVPGAALIPQSHDSQRSQYYNAHTSRVLAQYIKARLLALGH